MTEYIISIESTPLPRRTEFYKILFMPILRSWGVNTRDDFIPRADTVLV
jgi:hypothetical protein